MRNQFDNPIKFIEKWDKSYSRRAESLPKNIKGTTGIINRDGVANCSVAMILTKNDPRFYENIEEGVRRLISELICIINCVTYSSCEGHPFANGYTKMHVGIIPRNPDEKTQLLGVFYAIEQRLEIECSRDIHLIVFENELESVEGKIKCIDLIFESSLKAFSDYEIAIKPFVDHFIYVLSEVVESKTVRTITTT